MPKQPASPPPAYFLSLSLENVRSFGDKQTISFAKEDGRPAQWTIILGDNGVGKTTVLKSLVALMPTEQPPPAGLYSPSYSGKWTYNWNPRRHQGQKNTCLTCRVLGKKYLFDDEKYAGLAEKFNLGIQILDPNEAFLSVDSASDNTFPSVANLVCYSYGAGRSIGSSSLGAPLELVDDNCKSLFDDRADLLNPEEWFLQMEYSSFKDKGSARFVAQSLERVKQALLLVLPDIDDIQIKTTKRKQQQLELLTPYGWVRLRDMSLGYQTLVVWLTDFASKLFIRYPDSPNPLEEPAIVLIDEIDLHLHPSWQRKLIGFLSGIFKNTQFIATAHSPLVVQAAGDQPSGANVVLLKREGDQTIVYQGADLPDVRSWRLDQILSSELFDEVPAHSPDTERRLQRRDALLAKARLTAAEKKELAELNDWDARQPVGDSQAERKAADVLRELARKLGKQDLLD